MTEYKESFRLVIDELKMYRELVHGSYCYPFMHTSTYNTVNGKRTIHFTIIQVTGWKFIYKILNYKYKRVGTRICLVDKRKKKQSFLYPIQVYHDYMKSHLDYLKQLSLPALLEDYNKYEAYYESNYYSKWFTHSYIHPTQQYDTILIEMKENQRRKYYDDIVSELSQKLKRKRVIRFSSSNLREIYSYLV